MKLYSFRTIIEPDENGYHGFVPLLKGVHTCGDTLQEVKENLNEAIRCHVQGLLKDNEVVPNESDVFESVQSFSEKELLANNELAHA